MQHICRTAYTETYRTDGEGSENTQILGLSYTIHIMTKLTPSRMLLQHVTYLKS